jgi:hypothetical protein
LSSGTPDGLGGFHPALAVALLDPPQPDRSSTPHTNAEPKANFTLTPMAISQ